MYYNNIYSQYKTLATLTVPQETAQNGNIFNDEKYILR